MLSLVRHLPENGWYPVVLACKPVRGAGFDPEPLLDERVRAAPVVRAGSMDPYRLMQILRPEQHLGGAATPSAALGNKSGRTERRVMDFLRRHVFLPDDRRGWIPFAIARGVRLVRRHQVRVIYSSNYPQSAHVVAAGIRLLTGVPWLADFRDGWTQNPVFYRPGNLLIRFGQRVLERYVARHAEQIVTVSPPITRHLSHFRQSCSNPVITIFNGFDPEEFELASTMGETGEPLNPGCLTILCAGSFFGRRRPDVFLAAVSRLLRARPVWRDRLRVRFRSVFSPRENRLVERLNLKEVVEVLPPIPFHECLREQQRADACLLILERGPGSDIMVSQKIFEYLASGRPVFADVPEGAAAELLAMTGGASVGMDESPGAMARRLHRFLGQVANGTAPKSNKRRLNRFERAIQAREIAKLLDRIALEAKE